MSVSTAQLSPTWLLSTVACLITFALGLMSGADWLSNMPPVTFYPGTPTIPFHLEAHSPIDWVDHPSELVRIRDVENDLICWVTVRPDGDPTTMWCSPGWALAEPEDEDDGQ
jgi:hypothetical protein